MLNRREFLKLSGALGGTLALPRLARSRTAAGNDQLVFLFLRGAMDSLHFLVPHAEQRYYDLRPNLAVPRPGETDGVLDLDGFFGLHPRLAPLADLYAQDRLALVAAAGSPDPSHSHFESQDYAEFGVPGDKSIDTGWLGRMLQETSGGDSPFRALGYGERLQKSLYGADPAVAVAAVDDFALAARNPAWGPTLEGLYAPPDPLAEQADTTFAALEQFAVADPSQYAPENGAEYPQGEMGDALAQVSQLIKADLGAEVICVDAGGWDTHADEASRLDGLFEQLAAALGAFHTDLGARMDGITLVAMTEFGRRAYENASGGTDHGHGGCMLLLGGGVNGSRVYGDWPGLEDGDLYGAGDLEVVTDFRRVLSEVAVRRLGATDPEGLFPGFAQEPFLGVCQG